MRVIAIRLVMFCCVVCSSLLQSGNTELSFFVGVVERETKKIQHAALEDVESLSDAYASRGESYLLLDRFEEALSDFEVAYAYASLSDGIEGRVSQLRALINTFFIYAFLGDLESTQLFFDIISPLITGYACCEQQTAMLTGRWPVQSCAHRDEPEPNYPILGPDRISKQECADRVAKITETLQLLCAAIPNTQARALAIVLINQLETQAQRCCWAGGLWKGCLQKLVNKLHYWQLQGAPSDLSYYTGVNFM